MSNLIYLITSLPSLSFGQPPPLSFDQFYLDAKEQLSNKDFETLHKIDLQLFDPEKFSALKEFFPYMEALKWEMNNLREARKNDRTPTLLSLPKNMLDQNPLEREKTIMKWQWDLLSDLDMTDPFSLKVVFVYKLKLQILHRLYSFNPSKGLEILEVVVNPPKKEKEI